MENVLVNVWNGIISTSYEAYYQPQYNSVTNEVVGFEALARLNDPNGIVSPANFISVLENNGMIAELDSFIFKSVCAFINKCINENARIVPVSVNLSRYDFDEINFISKLEKIRKSYNIDTNLLRIEINDSIITESKEKAINIINKFHECGYVVELDNFVASDLNIDFVKEKHFDVVKLDMFKYNNDFVENNGNKILSVLKEVQKSNISIIAQGVERKEQVDFLLKEDCKCVQGYYFAKPMAESSAYDLVKQSGTAVLLENEKSYQEKFECILKQLDAYYCEYNICTKEMYPCNRSISEFGLTKIVSNCPEGIIEKNIISNDCVEEFRELFNQINKGSKHLETTLRIGPKDEEFLIRCDTEFDDKQNPVRACCLATKVDSNNKKKQSYIDGKSLFKKLKI